MYRYIKKILRRKKQNIFDVNWNQGNTQQQRDFIKIRIISIKIVAIFHKLTSIFASSRILVPNLENATFQKTRKSGNCFEITNRNMKKKKKSMTFFVLLQIFYSPPPTYQCQKGRIHQFTII